MAHYGYPVLFVLFLWWFSTGAVIFLNNLPRRTFRFTLAIATIVLIVSLIGIYLTKGLTSGSAPYISFTCGLLIWAWTQLTFYMGAITGPRTTACHPSCGGLKHFWHAVETCLYHEVAALAAGGLILALSLGGDNQVGLWTYVILWVMHLSAKLNVVFGVRNLNEQFFPEHLKYLRSFLRERSMNTLFPFSITIGTIVTVLLIQRAAAAPHQFDAIAYSFYACLMTLALIEHWFLVLPLPFAELWNWGLEARKIEQDTRHGKPEMDISTQSKDKRILPLKLAAGSDTVFSAHPAKTTKVPSGGKTTFRTSRSADILAFRKRK